MQMKAAILLVALSVVVLAQGASYPYPRVQPKLSGGYIRPGDRLLNRTYLQRNPIPNAIQYQDFYYTGFRVSYFNVTEVGWSQYATAWVTSGGVGWNQLGIRVQSTRGYGYYVMVEVWGQ